MGSDSTALVLVLVVPVRWRLANSFGHSADYDKVPNGIYQVDLNFAELTSIKIGKRLYDVIIENTMVLPAHDIAYEVGVLKADKHTFFVEVADGQMDVRLIARAGYEKPVINSLRITHRPDR